MVVNCCSKDGLSQRSGHAIADAAGGILGLGNRLSSAEQDRL
jgi:hypothetical protein